MEEQEKVQQPQSIKVFVMTKLMELFKNSKNIKELRTDMKEPNKKIDEYKKVCKVCK